MKISPQDLAAEYHRARADWPFITQVNDAHGMPSCLLYAVGSRETNLKNVVGDSGHGHGVFQLDDRSHQIPPEFDQDVQAQAQIAAGMLAAAYGRFGNWMNACNYYNSGSPDTSSTTGGDYGPDVMERQAYLSTLSDQTAMPMRVSLTGSPGAWALFARGTGGDVVTTWQNDASGDYEPWVSLGGNLAG
jgi:hypothetical protein